MGGIAGIFNGNTRKLKNMTLSIAHRGGDVFYSDELASLGKKAYSKILYGHKFNSVFDGKLLNSEELTKELTVKGHTISDGSEAELVLLAYIEWGASCPEKLIGNFAFAIADGNDSLFLARDALGVRPLYYAQYEGAVFFASEIKALLAAGVPAAMDNDGICRLFSVSPASPPSTTLYKDIFEVSGGESILFSGQHKFSHIYFQLFESDFKDSADTASDTVINLISDTLYGLSANDSDVCCLLSGGLDSSLLTSLMCKQRKNIQTYSIEFENSDDYFTSNSYQVSLDSTFVKIVSKYLGCENTTIKISNADLASALEDAVFARDMPGMADVDSSLLVAFKEISKSHKSVISGECADEVFCGYPWFHKPELTSGEYFPWSGSLELRRSIMSDRFASMPIEEYAKFSYESAMRSVPTLCREKAMHSVNLRWVGSNLINRTDRMCSAFGMTAYMPFADARLLKYAYDMPREMLDFNGYEKGILRKAAEGLLPEEVLYRKKSPYPKTHSPEYTRIVSVMLADILDDKNAPIHELINTKAVLKFIKEGIDMTVPWYGQLMTGPQLFAFLIQINIWLDKYGIMLHL